MSARRAVARARAHGARLTRFAGIGVLNTACDFGVFAGLLALGTHPLLANAAAFVIANLQSFLLNARVTFRSGGAPARVSLSGYAKFAAAHLASLAISTAFVAAFSRILTPLGAKAASAVFTFAWNYAASAFFVFCRPAPLERSAPIAHSQARRPS
jgi:putative flippase GtrA